MQPKIPRTPKLTASNRLSKKSSAVSTAQLSMRRRSARRRRGSILAEVAPTLWIMLFFLFFPLLDLATVGMRYTFALSSCRDASQAACIAKTFYADLDAQNLSAVNTASTTAAREAGSWKGLVLISTQTNLVITNIATQTVTRRTTPLTAPADTSQNIYQIEVILTADVSPLITYRGALFGNIQGLTGPLRVSISTQQYAENTNGLDN